MDPKAKFLSLAATLSPATVISPDLNVAARAVYATRSVCTIGEEHGDKKMNMKAARISNIWMHTKHASLPSVYTMECATCYATKAYIAKWISLARWTTVVGIKSTCYFSF